MADKALSDREAARRVAARVGLPGVPISLRDHPHDAPGDNLGTGHWRRHAQRLSAAYERATVAVAQLPEGGLRDELDALLRVLKLRLDRYTRIAQIGQALLPDDDTTDLDGTAPGTTPYLDGAAAQFDARLADAHAHLASLGRAVELIVLAELGFREPAEVTALVADALRDLPAP